MGGCTPNCYFNGKHVDQPVFFPGFRTVFTEREFEVAKCPSQIKVLQHNSLRAAGHGVKLAIQYRKFLFAQVPWWRVEMAAYHWAKKLAGAEKIVGCGIRGAHWEPNDSRASEMFQWRVVVEMTSPIVCWQLCLEGPRAGGDEWQERLELPGAMIVCRV